MKQDKNCRDEQGLRECIAQAQSVAEINTLLAIGRVNFTGASRRTRNAWANTSKRRIVELLP